MHGCSSRRHVFRASSAATWPALVFAFVMIPTVRSGTCRPTKQALAVNATSCETAPLCNVHLGYHARWNSTTLAGNRSGGGGYVDGVAAAARFFTATSSARGSLSFAPDGSKVFFADTENDAVREILVSTGATSTLGREILVSTGATSTNSFAKPFTVLPSRDGSQQIVADRFHVKLVTGQTVNILEAAAGTTIQVYWGAALSPAIWTYIIPPG